MLCAFRLLRIEVGKGDMIHVHIMESYNIEQASLSTAAPVFRIFGVFVVAFVSWRYAGFEGRLCGLVEMVGKVSGQD